MSSVSGRIFDEVGVVDGEHRTHGDTGVGDIVADDGCEAGPLRSGSRKDDEAIS